MLPRRLSAALDVSVPESQKIIKAFKSCLLEELKEKGSIILVGLGTLRVRERGARKGRNPPDGQGD